MKLVIYPGLLMLLSLSCYAQSRKGDIEVSADYGKTSGTEIILVSPLAPGVTEDSKYTKNSAGPIYTASCGYFVSSRISLNAVFAIQHLSYYYTNEGYKTTLPNSTLNANFITVAFELKGIYVNTKYFQFYGIASLGIRSFKNHPDSEGHETPLSPIAGNMQISPLCLYFGGKLGAFVEMGIGYKGLINGGISYRCSTRYPAKKRSLNSYPDTQ